MPPGVLRLMRLPGRSAALSAALALAIFLGAGLGQVERRVASKALGLVAAAPALADLDFRLCRKRIAETESEAPLPGAPAFEAERAAILGRARGEPVLWAKEPGSGSPPIVAPGQASWRTLRELTRRFERNPAELRTRVLRDGYVYSSDPETALALVTLVELPKLFDEPEIVLERGGSRHRLVRSTGNRPIYRYAGGALDGARGELLLGDRVATTESGLGEPLHRDLATWSHAYGAGRIEVLRVTRRRILARAQFGALSARVLLKTTGARVELDCVDAPRTRRLEIEEYRRTEAPQQRALGRLREAVTALVKEALPFDRPRGEPGPDRDGQLRPEWRWAYKSGVGYFRHDDEIYPVFDALGRAFPPQVCVDFVLDSYERGAGNWFASRGAAPGRSTGRLDFDGYGSANRRAVLAFESFAASRPDLFDVVRFSGEERIPFGQRARFFRFLTDHAVEFQAGDIVAIQGRKSDGKIHQHALLIEATDPITGFPHALADQMRMPRRRTWETIMAEAPLRSLLYRVRPKASIFKALAAD